MEKKIRLLCSVILAFALLCTLSLFDKETVKADDHQFTIDRNDALLRYSGTGGIIEIPQGVKIIAKKAFAGNTDITAVVMPDSVEVIEGSAFDSCNAITEVKLGKGIKTIGDMAFWSCTALESISIPESCTEIGFGAFCGCTSLKGMYVPGSVQTISNRAIGFVYAGGSYYVDPGFLILGENASVAQTYAEKDNITFLTKEDLTAKINKASNNKKGKASVTWYRNPNVSGYQIQYATNKKFSKAKTVTASTDNSSKTISSMKKGKTYYFRVRGYRTVAGTKYYSDWSTSKSIKIKK